jgi:hypothetical protein
MKLMGQDLRTRPDAQARSRSVWLAALVFCLSTFVVSSFRASLNPENAFALFDPRRMVLIAAGAVVFWLTIRAAGRHAPGQRDLVRIARVAAPAMAVLFAIAIGWDLLIAKRFDDVLARNLRWMLLWSGYFGTGLAAWLAVQYGTALAQAHQPDAADGDAEPDSAAGHANQDNGAPLGFWVKTGRQTVRIAQDDIEWIEAEGNYVRIHDREGGHGLVRMSMARMAAALGEARFVRVHRSALCRRSAIKGFRRKSSGAMLVLLANGGEAPLGRSYARTLGDSANDQALDASDASDDTVSQRRHAADRM